MADSTTKTASRPRLAARRSAATMHSHLTPPTAEAAIAP
jgi:hypothetical protein